jgi:proliferating cell nuclear antigen
MVEIALQEVGSFKRIIDSLKDLVEDITFDCETSGMSLQAMDPSHIAVACFFLPSDFFTTYRCSEPLSLSFSRDTLSAKVLRGVGPDDELLIRADSSTDDIEIQLTSPSQEKSTRFRLRAIDVEHDVVAIPDRHYRARLGLPSGQLSQLVKNLAEVSDTVAVRCSDGSIQFSVNDKLLDATTTFNAGVVSGSADDEVDVDVTEACKVSYALRYLRLISSASGLAPRVSLSFAPDFPLLVEYGMRDGAYMRFYLAPKVEEDESSDEL